MAHIQHNIGVDSYYHLLRAASEPQQQYRVSSMLPQLCYFNSNSICWVHQVTFWLLVSDLQSKQTHKHHQGKDWGVVQSTARGTKDCTGHSAVALAAFCRISRCRGLTHSSMGIFAFSDSFCSPLCEKGIAIQVLSMQPHVSELSCAQRAGSLKSVQGSLKQLGKAGT